MDIKEKLELIKKNAIEILGEEKLKSSLEKNSQSYIVAMNPLEICTSDIM